MNDADESLNQNIDNLSSQLAIFAIAYLVMDEHEKRLDKAKNQDLLRESKKRYMESLEAVREFVGEQITKKIMERVEKERGNCGGQFITNYREFEEDLSEIICVSINP